MRIYKGEAGVTLTLENFLDLLEEDALEDIIDMVLDLEATGSINGQSLMGDFDGDLMGDDVVFLGVLDLSDFDGDIEELLNGDSTGLESILDYLVDEPGFFDAMSEEDFESLFGTESTLGGSFLSDEDILDNFFASNEDLRVKRIVQRFHHILDAQK
jgi:hypothetical protein